MTRKELTKMFMMISNWKTPFGLYGLYKNSSVLNRVMECNGVMESGTVVYVLQYYPILQGRYR